MFARGCVLRWSAVSARRELGLQDGQSYTPADIKKVFRKKALTAHPDTGGDPDYFRQLQSAYEVLLHEHGVGKKDGEAATATADSRSGSDFYAHPHTEWDHDTHSRRAYWRDMHTEMNMNTNHCGNHQHASNTHYRARAHYRTYGEGLGENFKQDFESSAFAGDGHRGSQANFSTWYFYRPYCSDYQNPYATGFTPEEIHRAEQERRRGFARALVRNVCLWSGLAFVVYLHQHSNRIRRAKEARDKGYNDPEYWEQLRKEEEEARRKNRKPLRLEQHWLDAPPISPLAYIADDDRSCGCSKNDQVAEHDISGAATAGTACATQRASMSQERRRQVSIPTRGMLRGGGGSMGGPRVVSYQGRPFTPNGVRGMRNTAPKTPKTYADDVTYEMEEDDDDDV
ncbi:hypothetical protein, conserved [Leishmania tarentolae]|uniref:J domain-containing protein n=1 Tax=Leishmania tarentolae TaxID=5689 RepID=A0A640KMI8_LEITA|nr:hypothetical protein, conserved [Leishmania tarentolae]